MIVGRGIDIGVINSKSISISKSMYSKMGEPRYIRVNINSKHILELHRTIKRSEERARIQFIGAHIVRVAYESLDTDIGSYRCEIDNNVIKFKERVDADDVQGVSKLKK